MFEEGLYFDVCYGCFMNVNFVEYYVFVNVDIGVFDVSFVDESDMYFNLFGICGIGEIGIIGVLVVIVNVVYYVIGVWVCDLLIMFDKVVMLMCV